MKKNILSCIFILFATFAFSQDGKKLFQNNCKTCHTIGHGKLVGPDLKDVPDRREESFLIKWIKSSKTLIKAKNRTALQIFKEYDQFPMTDFSFLSDEKIKSIIVYIRTQSSKIGPSKTTLSPMTSPTVLDTTSTATTTTVATSKSSKMAIKTISPHSFFSNLGLALVVLFFLIIILVMASTIKFLSKELKENYKSNKE